MASISKLKPNVKLPAALEPMRDTPNWVIWKLEEREGQDKPAKMPYQSRAPQKPAKVNIASTWSDFATAAEASRRPGFAGVGFVFTGRFSAIDLDHCRNSETGLVEEWAMKVVNRLGSFTEISVSGTGLHIIGASADAGLPISIHKKFPFESGSIEIYQNAGRFIALTFNELPEVAGRPLVQMGSEITALYDELKAGKSEATPEDQQTQWEVDQWIKDGYPPPPFDKSAKDHSINLKLLSWGYSKETILKRKFDPKNGISAYVNSASHGRKVQSEQIEHARRDLSFDRDKKSNKIRSTPRNFRVAMAKLNIELSYNIFDDAFYVKGLPGSEPRVDGKTMIKIRTIVEQIHGMKVSEAVANEELNRATVTNPFHPVLDYFGSLKWDGVKRIDKWLTTYGGAIETPYTRAAGRKFLIAAVRRIKQPGYKFDHMLVLVGEQGTGKSTAASVLAVREEWFSRNLSMTADTKKVMEQIRGKLIVENDELQGGRRADVSHQKHMVTNQNDESRLSYGKLREGLKRQCVFIGTTNMRQFLQDHSGNRRYWPVETFKWNIVAMQQDIDQLWAEAVLAEVGGEEVFLPEEVEPEAQAEQDKRLLKNVIMETLTDELSDFEGKIATKSLLMLLRINPATCTPAQYEWIGVAMPALDWNPGLVRYQVGGIPKSFKGWLKGPVPRRTIMAIENPYDRTVSLEYLKQEDE